MMNTLFIVTSFLIGEDGVELRPRVAQPTDHIFSYWRESGRKDRGTVTYSLQFALLLVFVGPFLFHLLI